MSREVTPDVTDVLPAGLVTHEQRVSLISASVDYPNKYCRACTTSFPSRIVLESHLRTDAHKAKVEQDIATVEKAQCAFGGRIRMTFVPSGSSTHVASSHGSAHLTPKPEVETEEDGTDGGSTASEAPAASASPMQQQPTIPAVSATLPRSAGKGRRPRPDLDQSTSAPGHTIVGKEARAAKAAGKSSGAAPVLPGVQTVSCPHCQEVFRNKLVRLEHIKAVHPEGTSTAEATRKRPPTRAHPSASRKLARRATNGDDQALPANEAGEEDAEDQEKKQAEEKIVNEERASGRDKYTRDAGYNVFTVLPSLSNDTSLLVYHCARTRGKTVDQLRDQIQAIWSKLLKLEDKIPLIDRRNCQDVATGDRDLLGLLLLRVLLPAQNKSKSLKAVYRSMNTSSTTAAEKKLKDHSPPLVVVLVNPVTKSTQHYLHFDLHLIKVTRGGLPQAMLALLAASFLLNLSFAPEVNSLLAVLWLEMGLPDIPILKEVTKARRMLKTIS